MTAKTGNGKNGQRQKRNTGIPRLRSAMKLHCFARNDGVHVLAETLG
jgi:hypothetical protein